MAVLANEDEVWSGWRGDCEESVDTTVEKVIFFTVIIPWLEYLLRIIVKLQWSFLNSYSKHNFLLG